MPIAVWCTLRRLVTKVVCRQVVEESAELLAPHQLGYGIHGGSKAAVHGAWWFINDNGVCHAMVKLGFENAFDSVWRECMLAAVLLLCTSLNPFTHSAYDAPSNFFLE